MIQDRLYRAQTVAKHQNAEVIAVGIAVALAVNYPHLFDDGAFAGLPRPEK